MEHMKPYTRCAGYPRNSDPRKKDSATLEPQEKEIRRYIEKMKAEGRELFNEKWLTPEEKKIEQERLSIEEKERQKEREFGKVFTPLEQM